MARLNAPLSNTSGISSVLPLRYLTALLSALMRAPLSIEFSSRRKTTGEQTFDVCFVTRLSNMFASATRLALSMSLMKESDSYQLSCLEQTGGSGERALLRPYHVDGPRPRQSFIVISFFLGLSVTPPLPVCVLLRCMLSPPVLFRTLFSTRVRILEAAPSVSSTVFTTSFTGSGIACFISFAPLFFNLFRNPCAGACVAPIVKHRVDSRKNCLTSIGFSLVIRCFC